MNCGRATEFWDVQTTRLTPDSAIPNLFIFREECFYDDVKFTFESLFDSLPLKIV